MCLASRIRSVLTETFTSGMLDGYFLTEVDKAPKKGVETGHESSFHSKYRFAGKAKGL
jgi:hypothetical protein